MVHDSNSLPFSIFYIDIFVEASNKQVKLVGEQTATSCNAGSHLVTTLGMAPNKNILTVVSSEAVTYLSLLVTFS